MRNAWIDRSVADRRLGMRRAAVAAWVVVFALFALVLLIPGPGGGASAGRPAAPDRAIATLVDHAVQPVGDACYSDEFDHLAMAPAPSLC